MMIKIVRFIDFEFTGSMLLEKLVAVGARGEPKACLQHEWPNWKKYR